MTSRVQSVVSRVALGLFALVIVGYGIWRALGGAVGIADWRLPEFPNGPQPMADLSAGGEGEFCIATDSLHDFDILLRARLLPVPTTGFGSLILPEGASNERLDPAVVLVHGGGGISPGREMRIAQTVADAEIAAFVIDSFAPRGITRETHFMTKVLAFTEFDATPDAYAGFELLSTHPAIDGRRIGVMGFSYGGMAVRIAMDERVRETFVPTLRGTDDKSNDLEACAAREAELRALGVEVGAHIYAGAGHAWEASTPRRLFEDSPYVAGGTIRYDEKGYSWIGDIPIVTGDPGDSRAQRVVMWLSSGGRMADCVGLGYVIGREDETSQNATTASLEFLTRTLRPGGARASGGV